MHDTALKIGSSFLKNFAISDNPNILEVGSYDVNGSLRRHVGSEVNYVGLDFEPGPGVDIVVKPGAPFPVENDHFDLVIASSALEHDPAFWVTFLEMCRKVKSGGYLYINVPSNGVVHRYPQDCWRFYPDAGRALASWAKAQGQNVTLIESFIAKRESDIWNDFIAVFQKDRGAVAAPSILLHEQFQGWNVLVGEVGGAIDELAESEDMILRAQACAEAERLQTLRAQSEERAMQACAEAERLQTLLAQSEERATQASIEKMSVEVELDLARQTNREIEAKQIATADALNQSRQDLESSKVHIITLNEAIMSLRSNVAKLEWLKNLNSLLMSQPWWWNFLSTKLKRRFQLKMVSKAGIFDSERYLLLHADVRESGFDPLRHYILHGLSEGRAL